MIFDIANSARRQAAALRVALIGNRMTWFETSEAPVLNPQIGRVIEEVRVFGREIEIIWDDGVVLRTKMRINGAWKIFRASNWGEMRGRSAQVVIGVEDRVVACFGALDVETHHDFDPRRHPLLGPHGPDLSDPKLDHESCVDRMIAYEDSDATVAEVLLDQRVMRGIGNVFRCELLWSCELHPWAKISSLNRDECRELVAIAAEMLQPESSGRLATLAVYGRHGKECERCGGQIRVTHHGEANRVLYWCAECQTRHSGSGSTRYVTEHDTPPNVHPAEFIYLSDLERARKSG